MDHTDIKELSMHDLHGMYQQFIKESLKISNQKSRGEKLFEKHLLLSKMQKMLYHHLASMN